MLEVHSLARLGAIGSTLLVMSAAAAPAAAKTRTIHLSAITQHADINAGVSSKASLKLETTAGKRAGSAT